MGSWYRDAGAFDKSCGATVMIVAEVAFLRGGLVSIVFVQVTDPVGLGLVASLARPGGNATGFTLSEFGTSGKWLELLKEIVPRVARAGILRDSSAPGGIGQFAAIQTVAPSIAVELIPLDVRDAGEIELAIATFARSSNGGLIVTASGLGASRPDRRTRGLPFPLLRH